MLRRVHNAIQQIPADAPVPDGRERRVAGDLLNCVPVSGTFRRNVARGAPLGRG